MSFNLLSPKAALIRPIRHLAYSTTSHTFEHSPLTPFKTAPQVAQELALPIRPPEKIRPVILYMNLLGGDHAPSDNPVLNYERRQKQWLKLQPSARIVPIIYQKHDGHISEKISEALLPDEEITHLMNRTHGTSSKVLTPAPATEDQVLDHEETVTPPQAHPLIDLSLGRDRSIVFIDEKARAFLPAEYSVDPENTLFAEDVFREIQGRFAQNSRIMISACRIVAGDESEAEQNFKLLQRSFHLKDSLIYANRTDGMEYSSLYSQVVFKQ